jgi:hypothetical protein
MIWTTRVADPFQKTELGRRNLAKRPRSLLAKLRQVSVPSLILSCVYIDGTRHNSNFGHILTLVIIVTLFIIATLDIIVTLVSLPKTQGTVTLAILVSAA